MAGVPAKDDVLAGLPHGYAVPFPDSSTLGMSPRGHAPVALTTDSGRSDERCRLQPLQLPFRAEMHFQCTCSNGQQCMYLSSHEDSGLPQYCCISEAYLMPVCSFNIRRRAQ